MGGRAFNVAAGMSAGVLAVVVVGTACHAAFRAHQRALLTWETSTHRYEVGFKALGVQFARGGLGEAGAPASVVPKARFGNWLLLCGDYDVIAASGATSHHVYVHAGGFPLLAPALLPAVWLWRRRRVRRRLRAGVCPACGYDVRATPGRCPECGLSGPGAASRNLTS